MKLIRGGAVIDADGKEHAWREEVEIPETQAEWTTKLNALMVKLFRDEQKERA